MKAISNKHFAELHEKIAAESIGKKKKRNKSLYRKSELHFIVSNKRAQIAVLQYKLQ